ncbi:hypothetical protein [Aureimonas ureilytica]|uniref:hypothetical protein n=1 Tax=Aureimonas ureilytica TaxID=401562 RepID=UPI00037E18B8|nr:hypothetical protein [Aureimonas ureilytica]
MTFSDQERRIRSDVVSRLRVLLPGARIIHELDVEKGAVRADLAAVTVDQLWLVEIKSEKDKLHRLSRQIQFFHPVCHGLLVAAHEKWCGRAANYPNCDARKVIEFHGAGHLWQWPGAGAPTWTLPEPRHPWTRRMLDLLSAEEVRAEAVLVGFGTPSCSAAALADQMCLRMSGHAVTQAVCRQLRARSFSRADAPELAA